MGEVLTGEALLLVLTCNDWISEQSSTGKLSKLSLSVTFSGVSIIFLASAGEFLSFQSCIKVVFIKKDLTKTKKQVNFTKRDEDFKLALSWVMSGKLFVKKIKFYFSMK